MSIYVMVPVFKATGLTPNEKLVSLALADNAHDDGTEARPGMATMVQKTALSERTVQRTLKALLGKSIIAVQRTSTNTQPTVYRFLLTPDGSRLAIDRGDNLAPPGNVGGDKSDVRGDKSDVLGRHSDTQTVKNLQKETSSSSEYSERFESLWAIYPRKKEKKSAYKAAKARIRAGANYADMIDAVTNYAAAMLGTEERFIKLPATFFGPDDKWRDWLTPAGNVALGTVPGSDDWEAELERRRMESSPPPKNFAASVREQMKGNG